MTQQNPNDPKPTNRAARRAKRATAPTAPRPSPRPSVSPSKGRDAPSRPGDYRHRGDR